MTELIDVNMEILHEFLFEEPLELDGKLIFVCVCVCLSQCHPAGVPGGAVEELGGNAGANAGRERFPGDRVSP